MSVLAGNALSHRHALFFCLVRQHGATNHVAHCPHVRKIGFAFTVHHNRTALIQAQAHDFRVQANGVGNAADRNNEFVNLQHLRFALGIGISDRHALRTILNLAHLHAQLDFQALLHKDLVRFLGNLLINRTKESR